MPPVNATITVANNCYSSSTGTQYSLALQYDINATTVTLSVNDCNANSTPSTVKVKVTDLPAGTSYVSIQPNGYSSSITGSNSSSTVNIYPDDIQSDGKVSFAAVAQDSSGHGLSYGVLTDQTLVSGMTVTIAANQPLSNVQYQINNIPSTAKNISPWVQVARKITSFSSSSWENLVTSGTSTTIAVSYIPAFGDAFVYGVYLSLDQNSNGTNDSSLSIYKWGTTAPVDQTFDFSQMQMPVIASNLAVTGSGTATPTMTWSGTDASAIVQIINMQISTTVTTTYSQLYVYTSTAPTRTSVTYPQLPDSLATFRPTGVTSFSVGNQRSDIFTDYADYQSKLEQYNNGTWTIPAAYTSKSSTASYSSTQTLAPAINKVAKPFAKRAR